MGWIQQEFTLWGRALDFGLSSGSRLPAQFDPDLAVA
jgi:hypothetical protein